jgi:hypothetical protein
VIDAYIRLSLVGIELVTIDARIVIASVDTYLRFAEAVNRLDISQHKETMPELVGDLADGGAGKSPTGEGALNAGARGAAGRTRCLPQRRRGTGRRAAARMLCLRHRAARRAAGARRRGGRRSSRAGAGRPVRRHRGAGE